MIVHHPQWQRAREWLEAGEIGTLRHVDAAFSFHLTDTDNIRNRPTPAADPCAISASIPSALPAS